MAVIASAHSNTPAAFNATFYATVAVIIPVLYLTLVVQPPAKPPAADKPVPDEAGKGSRDSLRRTRNSPPRARCCLQHRQLSFVVRFPGKCFAVLAREPGDARTSKNGGRCG